jgi:hypothetical protein
LFATTQSFDFAKADNKWLKTWVVNPTAKKYQHSPNWGGTDTRKIIIFNLDFNVNKSDRSFSVPKFNNQIII